MNTPQKVDAIRSRCIEANPEIRNTDECFVHDRTLQGGLEAGDSCLCKFRPIRLADVVQAHRGRYSPTTAYTFSLKVAELVNYWDCKQDDLTKQSPETISFLADLLTPKGEPSKEN